METPALSQAEINLIELLRNLNIDAAEIATVLLLNPEALKAVGVQV